MLNLIAFITCIFAAMYWAFAGDVSMVLFEFCLALINVPFMIERMKG